MRHLLLVVALLASVTTHGEAQNDAQKSAAMERELRGLYQHLLDALRAKDTAAVRPILADGYLFTDGFTGRVSNKTERLRALAADTSRIDTLARSEEHTSELQSQSNLVCRLLLEKKKNRTKKEITHTTL